MLNTLFQKLVIALVFGVAFVINPAYLTGCGSEEDEPDFGEAEMVALLADFNAMAMSEIDQGDARYEVELSLEQAEGDDVIEARAPSPFASTAYACGNRTFMKSAAACDTQTLMGVEGTLTVRRIDGDEPVVVVEDLPVSGQMRASSNQLRFVSIDLGVEGGGTISWITTNAKDFTLETFDADGLGEQAVDLHL